MGCDIHGVNTTRVIPSEVMNMYFPIQMGYVSHLFKEEYYLRINSLRENIVISSYDPFEGKVRVDKWNHNNMTIYLISDAISRPKLNYHSQAVRILLDGFVNKVSSSLLAAELARLISLSRGLKWLKGQEPFYRTAGKYYHEKDMIPTVSEVMTDFSLSRKQITKIYNDETGYNLKELMVKLLLVSMSDYCRVSGMPIQDTHQLFGFQRHGSLRKTFKENFNLPIECLSAYEINPNSIKAFKVEL